MAKLSVSDLKSNLQKIHEKVRELRKKHPNKKYKELLKEAGKLVKGKMKKGK